MRGSRSPYTVGVPPRHIAAALKWVNERREVLGMRPLKRLRNGIPERACACPIANSLQPAGRWRPVRIQRNTAYLDQRKYRLPHGVRWFIQHFDERA